MVFAGMNRISSDGRITSYPTLTGHTNHVTSFYRDRADRMWLGTPGGLLECRLPAMSCGDAPLGPGGIYALYFDSRDRLWAGMDDAFAVLEDGRWTEHRELQGNRARAFAETRDSAIWIGSNGVGLLRYQSGQITRITERDGLPSNLIRALYRDADGWLWIGTEGRGLARLDPRAWAAGSGGANRRIVRISTADGLFDEVIHQILEDDAGRLWMNTNRGVFWVARAELNAFAHGRTSSVHSTSYTERDGIRNREGNGGYQPAGVRARDGKLWFPTQDGVVFVDPAHVTSNRTSPPIVIERVAAGDSSFVPSGMPLELGVNQRDLQIEFTAPSFLEPGNVRFRYRLDPYDPDWVNVGSRRSAFYTRVPPGRYTFRVMASNNEGVWNEADATLDLSLAYRPWETAAFRLLLLVTFTLAVVIVVRWRGRRLRERAVELERVVDTRTRELRVREQQLETQAVQLQELDRAKSNFFANVSHEFRTPLTLTIGPLEDLQADFPEANGNRRRSLDMALRNARRLLRLVNQILECRQAGCGTDEAAAATARPGAIYRAAWPLPSILLRKRAVSSSALTHRLVCAVLSMPMRSRRS